ncbi:hypothetical protein K8640_05345 [Myxococcus sp. XM-1-1-1]|jgi:hypothetical protein|uniref:heavy metal-binding domain-containing protein n=1 Tax=Myxococcus sp. XM-1-1-1 TaxID=2874602 RepID=UPI001CBB572B|nr:heavy metal-binding domain-containing protein [Myxococcus sp. XM-1-1-1]MBZ4407625.1 hypothetical protein [Myxococcus sp. XM-1-1-1]
MRTFLSVLASLTTLAACASEPRRLAPSLDPSNPEAPESPAAPLSSVLAAAPPDAKPPRVPEAEKPAPPDAGTPLYTCPMHPEVQSDKPGVCPKCNMKLTPAKPTSGHEGHGEHR